MDEKSRKKTNLLFKKKESVGSVKEHLAFAINPVHNSKSRQQASKILTSMQSYQPTGN